MPQNLLVLDCSTPRASAVLVIDGAIGPEQSVAKPLEGTQPDTLGNTLYNDLYPADHEGPRPQSDALPLLAQQALAQAGLSFGHLHAIGVCLGPGSYTGLRVATAYVQGLCLALGINALPVSTLHAMACAALPRVPQQSNRPTHLLCALDAGRDEVYAAVFLLEQGSAVPNRVSPDEPLLLSGGHLAHILHGLTHVHIAGDGTPKVAATLARLAAEGVAVPTPASLHPEIGPTARCAALPALLDMQDTGGVPPQLLQPYYLKPYLLRTPGGGYTPAETI